MSAVGRPGRLKQAIQIKAESLCHFLPLHVESVERVFILRLGRKRDVATVRRPREPRTEDEHPFKIARPLAFNQPSQILAIDGRPEVNVERAFAVGQVGNLVTLGAELGGQIEEAPLLFAIGQGLANVVNGFFGGMGGCAMIGQSMINIRAGGRGRTSGITAALSLLGFIVFGASLIEQIPLAALVGIMFMVVIATFEWSSFRILKQIPKSDAFVLILVSAVTVFVDLAIAVIAGVIVSSLVFAWKKGTDMSIKESVNKEGEKVYTLKETLFFGSVSSFKETFNVQDDPKQVVINFKNARIYDHSGVEALQTITERYEQAGKTVTLKNLSKGCKALIEKTQAKAA